MPRFHPPAAARSSESSEPDTIVRYGTLLQQAHAEGLVHIQTRLLQAPTDQNGHLAIVSAEVRTDRGTFCGLGDASPQSVQRTMLPHLVRMAETRAKARGLRDALNISAVSLEELTEPPADRRPEPGGSVTPFRAPAKRTEGTMTTPQRRYLLRLLSERGLRGEAAIHAICDAAEVSDLDQVDRATASALIDRLKRGGEVRGA